jgi:hypothetical protein
MWHLLATLMMQTFDTHPTPIAEVSAQHHHQRQRPQQQQHVKQSKSTRTHHYNHQHKFPCVCRRKHVVLTHYVDDANVRHTSHTNRGGFGATPPPTTTTTTTTTRKTVKVNTNTPLQPSSSKHGHQYKSPCVRMHSWNTKRCINVTQPSSRTSSKKRVAKGKCSKTYP